MALISSLAAVVAPVFLIAAAGYVWGRLGRPFDHGFVTSLVTSVGAPCLVFSTLTRMSLPGSELALMAGATTACLLLFAAVAAVGLVLAGLPVRVYLPSLTFPNIGNMGLPVCLFAFQEQGLALAMIYFAVTTVFQFTAGPAIAAGRFEPRQLLRVPFIHAIVLALGVTAAGLPVPQWLDNTLTLAAGLTIPLMLLALGVALARFRVASLPRALALSAARLALGLAGGWLVASLLELDGTMRGVVLVQSAMPVAVFNYLFAQMHGNRPDEVAGMVLLSTVLSFLMLPLLVAAVMPT